MFYGVVGVLHATEIARAVCDTLGHGKYRKAVELMIETAAAETLLGTYRDPTERNAGSGVTQVDEKTFDWLRDKFSNRKEAAQIKEAFNITLSEVTYVELNNSPMLAFIWCRLRYRVVEDSIPQDIDGRAQYWKDNYNTEAGKGSVEEYLHRAELCGIAA